MGTPGVIDPQTRQAQEFQHAMPQRPAAAGRSRGRSGRAIRHGQRRELLRAGRGDARRGARIIRRSSASFSAPASAAASWSTARCSMAATASPASGARSSSIPTARFPTTARAARSRRSSPGPALERFYAEQSGRDAQAEGDRRARRSQDDPHAAGHHRAPDRSRSPRRSASIIDVLDPHAIVLGGGVGNIDALYTEETRQKITAAIFNPTLRGGAAQADPRRQRGRLRRGDAGGGVGASSLSSPRLGAPYLAGVRRLLQQNRSSMPWRSCRFASQCEAASLKITSGACT